VFTFTLFETEKVTFFGTERAINKPVCSVSRSILFLDQSTKGKWHTNGKKNSLYKRYRLKSIHQSKNR